MDTQELHDDFRGDDAQLIGCIKALLSLDAEGALRPHGVGGHGRGLLTAAAVRLGLAQEPLGALKAKLAASAGMAWTWQCKLAMAFYDALPESLDRHKLANEGAARVMSEVFEIDIKKDENYKRFEEGWKVADSASEEHARLMRHGKHVFEFAKSAGWVESEGEGAFEYIQRKSYAQGVEDGSRLREEWPVTEWQGRYVGDPRQRGQWQRSIDPAWSEETYALPGHVRNGWEVRPLYARPVVEKEAPGETLTSFEIQAILSRFGRRRGWGWEVANTEATSLAQAITQRGNKQALDEVLQAIRNYHYALDTRQHGGLAQDAAFNSICKALGAHWEQGAEKKRRENAKVAA